MTYIFQDMYKGLSRSRRKLLPTRENFHRSSTEFFAFSLSGSSKNIGIEYTGNRLNSGFQQPAVGVPGRGILPAVARAGFPAGGLAPRE
jgi:hypothetical protein